MSIPAALLLLLLFFFVDILNKTLGASCAAAKSFAWMYVDLSVQGIKKPSKRPRDPRLVQTLVIKVLHRQVPIWFLVLSFFPNYPWSMVPGRDPYSFSLFKTGAGECHHPVSFNYHCIYIYWSSRIQYSNSPCNSWLPVCLLVLVSGCENSSLHAGVQCFSAPAYYGPDCLLPYTNLAGSSRRACSGTRGRRFLSASTMG